MQQSPEPFWVELLSRHGEVLERHRVERGDVRIGRAYDNDIIIDDPYVGARHLRVTRDANGVLVAEDLGSANGLFAGESMRSTARVELRGEGTIRIGATRLRIREASHAVPPERRFEPRGWGWPVVAALAIAIMALEVVSTWLGQTTEPKLADYASPVFMLCLALFVWTAVWSILSRIFAGRARFRRNLLVGLAGLLVLSVLFELTDYGAFALSRRELTAYRYVGLWLAIGLFAFLHLRMISLSHLRLKAGAVAAAALAVIAMQTLSNAKSHTVMDRQNFVQQLKPPSLRLVKAESEPTFFAAAADLKASLDRARTQQPDSEDTDFGDD
ncbi:MAG TPA: FHA domain-containing protein [Burkholderiales bacterium]|nr:FHA domain-containing protein [Burkholderiales bacterium]